LVTDVGNDILYGFSAQQILAWVDEALMRLRRVTADIVVTDLPLESIRRLSNPAFLMFRSVLVPSCRLSRREVVDTAERVNAGLAELSVATRARFFHLKPEWYGLDPIHVRPSLWRPAWREILGVEPQTDAGGSRWESLRLYLMPPERRWLCGKEQITAQSGAGLPAGGRVWLY
jgi:hypothetical protein